MFAIDTFTQVQLDLNLLTALDALLEEGSVTGAANRLFLTPPAMSRTLGRIRHITGDQILVRTGRSMSPTPHAIAIRSEVHSIVQHAHAVLGSKQTLDLNTLERTFTLVCHDAITMAIGSKLVASIQSSAPGVVLRFLAEQTDDTNDLRHGTVDIHVGSSPPLSAEIHVETIGHDHLVFVVKHGHRLGKGRVTPARYAGARHVTISRRGKLHDPVDDALASLGLTRRVVAAAPTTAAALQFISDTDLVVAVASSVASSLGNQDFTARAIPLALPPTAVNLCWHRRNDNDVAHQWLREQTRAAIQRHMPLT
jgi:DNA-binding transcriptional LysR family regulator